MSPESPLLQLIPIGVLSEAISFGAGALTVIIGAKYTEHIRQKRKSKETLEEWFEETQSIFTHGFYLGRRTQFRPELQYDSVMQDISELYDRLLDKTHPTPDGVPEQAEEELKHVLQIYEKAKLVTEVGNEKNGRELAEELFEMAKVEYSIAPDSTLESSVMAAGDVSEGLGQFLEEIAGEGVPTEELIAGVEHMLTDWEPKDFHHFVMGASTEDKEVDQSVEIAVRILLELTLNISQGAYEAFEVYKRESIS